MVFESTCAALTYEGSAAGLLQRYKFRHDLAAGAALSAVLARVAATEVMPDAIMPVPSSRQRRRARGYDVALEIAREVARRLDLSLARGGASRPVDRVPQSSLVDWRQRRANVRGVFHVKPVAVRGKRVALVDDVMTSGATAWSLASAVRAAGARSVQVWVACRAGQPGPPGQASRFATDNALL